MAATINVAGLMTISVAAPGPVNGYASPGTLEVCGYSQDGVFITEIPKRVPVYGDANGGPEGEPIDFQDMPEVHKIRIVFTKYDSSVWTKLRQSLAGGTDGVGPTPGTLLYQSSKTFRVLINGSGFTRNYINCIIEDAKEFNVGTIHTKATMIITARQNPMDRILYYTQATVPTTSTSSTTTPGP